MKVISYLLELTTKVPITLDEQSLKEDRSFYEVVLGKAQEVVDNLDLNEQQYQIKVVSESKEGVIGNE